MEGLFAKTLTGLTPADDMARDALRSIKLGAILRVKLSRPRNLHHHRKFFALMQTVWGACEQWPSVEILLTDLKFRLGHVDRIMLPSTGQIVDLPRSISFSQMDQFEFETFYDRALRELCEMAGGIEHDALRDAVLDQLKAA